MENKPWNFMTEEKARALFLLAGFQVQRIHEMKNRYWGNDPVPYTGSWWLAETEFGNIRVGSRKRVIEIEWESTRHRAIITTDDVSKDDFYVHAWEWHTALKYLEKLRETLRKNQIEKEKEDAQHAE